ncbi:filamentous hemagglutinin N-terminal domain-containing protein [Scytonema sp. PCC 10023]|uniref:two-partner secretion domain-containing protein n=1 Tax=Scytonema sp. PCC 10023 TaxID=1680591 RepID=UPI0039C7364D
MSGISTCWGALLGIAIGGVSVWANCALAQITPDATLPNNSSVTSEGNNFNITGGTQAASNLFHSFKEFSVPTGSTAFFNNAADIQNIITRVTGGSVSNIDGLIKANGTANLFMINPNGIIFGPNARLNIGGSFIGSTASSINFADGTKFSATPSPDKPLLTITAPIGLGMGTNPGEIQVRGAGHEFVYDQAQIEYSNGTKPGRPRPLLNSSVPGLELESGKTLALVGGKVSVEGGVLKSPAGRIEIGSVASNGAVSLVSVPEGWKLGYEAAPSFADIQFSGKSFVSTTGVGGGAIAVAGKNINFTSESILRADTLGDRNGGEISIVGEEIGINQSDISSNSFSSGNTGQIKLVANNSIRLENQAGVGTRVLEAGKAGDITLQANSIFIGNKSGLSSNTDGTGNAGRMEVKANSFVIQNQSTLSNGTGNDSTGNGGEVNINVAGPLLLLGNGISGTSIDTYSFGQGDAGKINIRANSLRLENESAIVSRTQENSTGKAADINIYVAGPMVVKNAAILSQTLRGNAGKISITANSLLMEVSGVYSRTFLTGKGGEININVADSFESKSSGIYSFANNIGDAGIINIYANSLLFDSSQITSQATEKDSTGNAGDININVAGSMVLRNPLGIFTNSVGKGDAGKISIYANSFELENSQINSSTRNTGKAGDININIAGPMVINTGDMSTNTLGRGNAGQITVTAESLKINNGGIVATTNGSGNAGNLSVQTKTLVLDNQGRLEVESTGDGNAGTLNIVADTIQLDNQSRMNGTSTTGKGGDVELQIGNLLLLRRGSSISTSAGTDNKGGDGGNIRINAPNGFIVAVPNENSDITANAYSGTGGKITIKASDIFGIAPLSRQEIERLRPDDLDPSKLQTNDITAISQTNPSLSGTVEVNTPDIDPNTRLINLPSVPVDTEVAQGCNSPNYAQSSFIITGRGGLPPNPKDILTPDAVLVDWVTLNPNFDNRKSPSVSTPTKPTPEPIVEATGWVFNAKGEVVLTASAPTTTPRSSWQTSAKCRT